MICSHGMPSPGLRDRLTEALLFGACPTALLVAELGEPDAVLRDELRRMQDAGLVRSTNRGWQLRTAHQRPPIRSTR